MGEAKTEVSELRAQALHHEDQPREDPRRDRQGRRHHPCADRRDRLPDRHRGRRHRHHRRRPKRPRPTKPSAASSRSPPRWRLARSMKARSCKILDFGALVNLLPGKDGLLHISQIAHERVEKVHRLPGRRPDRQGQGAGNRRQGPHQAVHEGAAGASCGGAMPCAAERGEREPPRVDRNGWRQSADQHIVGTAKAPASSRLVQTANSYQAYQVQHRPINCIKRAGWRLDACCERPGSPGSACRA